MDRSLAFYHGLLGLRMIADEELMGPMLERAVGLAGASLRVVELGSGEQPPFLELLEYRTPMGRAIPVRPCDWGAHHVALSVLDIDASYARLIAEGVCFTAEPQEVGVGFFAGQRTAYCIDPDGLLVELWQPSACP